MIAQSAYEGDAFKVAILIIYDVCIRKELEHMNKSINFLEALSFSSNFRSGTTCLNFLFDLINEVSGYTDKYYGETEEVIDHEGLIQKYRKEKQTYEANGKNYTESPMFADSWPHSLMVLEGVQEFFKIPGSKY